MRKIIIQFFFLILFIFCVPPCMAEFLKLAYASEIPEVAINEICWMGNYTSSTAEWIELYNNTNEEIDLSGWKIIAKDGKPEIILTEKIGANGYYLAERTDDSTVPDVKADLVISFNSGLSNSGEELVLYNQEGVQIDMTPNVEEKKWAAGDNELKYSMERINPLLAGDDKLNWANSLLDGGTPKKINSTYGAEPQENNLPAAATSSPGISEHENDTIGSPESKTDENTTEDKKKDEKEEKKKAGSSKVYILRQGTILQGKIIISEIYPNPGNFDASKEFIELKNIGGQEINLEGWVVKSKFNIYKITRVDFPISIVPAGGFFLLPRFISNIPLNNEGDAVEVWSPKPQKADEISYKEYAQADVSYIKAGDGWQWTSTITPNADNILAAPNGKPRAFINSNGIKEAFIGQEVIFDATDSFDPDEDNLAYLWQVSDGEKFWGAVLKKKFASPGNYDVVLKIEDSYKQEADAKIKIKILENPWLENVGNGEKDSSYLITASSNSDNFFPAQEWADIKIFEAMPNPDGTDAKEEWIKLINYENYDVNLGGWMLDDAEGGSHPFQIPQDVAVSANGVVALSRDKTGIALNNDKDEVRLFDPDGNAADIEKYEKSVKGQSIIFNSQESAAGANGSGIEMAGNLKESESVLWSELEKYKDQEVKIEGKVSASPGILGKQIFYLTNETQGIEIYCFKSDFPELELGDYISAKGKLTEKDGWRITISGAEDINILSYEHPPLARELENLEGIDKYLHSLIMVSGQVLAKHSPNLFLSFGEKELKVYIKDSTGISLSEIKNGDSISVIGIVDLVNGEYRLLPRFQEDIHKLEKNAVLREDAYKTEGLEEGKASSTDYSDMSVDPENTSARKKNIIFLSISLLILIILSIWLKSKIAKR